MKALTETGKTRVNDLAIKYRISYDAVNSLLQSVMYGGGTQAQFNVSELGGMGQWMKGGMTMVGDMFNQSLKYTVDNLCTELSNFMYSEDNFVETTNDKTKDFFGSGTWWPSEYGSPSASGSQNNMRYAYFGPPIKRLVLEIEGKRSIYETQNYIISGVSQQQGNGQTLRFSSQLGPVNLLNLPLIPQPSNEPSDNEVIYTNAEGSITKEKTDNVFPSPDKDDVFVSIEKTRSFAAKGTDYQRRV